MQRSKFTAEFKAPYVKQVVDKGHNVVNVAARQGLDERVLYNWVRRHKHLDHLSLYQFERKRQTAL